MIILLLPCLCASFVFISHFRLMQSELLLWQHALLMTSFHAAISLKHSLFTNEAITFVVDFLALWFLLAIVAYIFIFQTMDKLTNKQVSWPQTLMMTLTAISSHPLYFDLFLCLSSFQVIFLCSVLITALIFNAPLLASSVSISVSACIGKHGSVFCARLPVAIMLSSILKAFTGWSWHVASWNGCSTIRSLILISKWLCFHLC